MRAVRVLLVEDEGVVRLMTEEYLGDNGFAVTEAWNGDEAARLLDEAEGFDVLFTDVRMPGSLDGVALAEHARRRQPEIPVLVVSGYAENLISRLRTLNPPIVFMVKPYDLAEVVRTLRRLTAKP